VFKINKIHK